MTLFLQLLVNGVALGGIYSLVALGFSLIFGVTRTFHFVHGSVYVASAYCYYSLKILLGWNIYITIVLTLLLAICMGILVETQLYRRMRIRGAIQITIFIAAFGTLLVIQNLIAIFYGNDAKNLRPGVIGKKVEIGEIIATHLQIEIVIIAIILFIALLLFLFYTKVGRNMRAVASNPEMARVVGINVDRVYWLTYAVGSALVVPAAILISYEFQATPDMGTWAVLMAVIALIVGGVNSVFGAGIAGMMLGIITNLGVWKIPSEWQSAIAFGILILFISFKPTGIFGKKFIREGV